MPSISVILLAAGYATRLHRDLSATPQLQNLCDIPKPLLPISGEPILSHWLKHLTHPLITSTTVITNAIHEQYYQAWRAKHSHDITILSNGTTSNRARHGAIADLRQALAHEARDVALIIAGDTLLPGADVNAIIDDFLATDAPAATLAYELGDMGDARRRGMLAVETRETSNASTATYAVKLVEKPLPENSPSNLACAPVYLLRGRGVNTVQEFMHEMKDQPLERRDAPGFWLSWLVERYDCLVYKVSERVDIGGLSHYKDALWKLSKGDRCKEEPAVGRAFPRVGMLGNPSDGYGGKVIAFALASEGFAEVVATDSETFKVIPNPELETPCEWDSVDGVMEEIKRRGLGFGARKLVLAAVAVFAEVCREYGHGVLPNCELSYSTSIPARVGLAGSSALVLATFRALARFCGKDMQQICPDVNLWPEWMRKAETEYLGIACGLMDRVVQVLQGVVWMDFSGETWKWERLQEDLPDMWLAYAREGGGECSGKVHGGLTKRFLGGDHVVKEVTDSLCAVVAEGRVVMERGEWHDFPELVTRNFELRCRLVGLEGVGQGNRRLVDVARKAGFAAKMTGSGGCALCVPNPMRKLSLDEVDSSRRQFEEAGFVLRKAKVLTGRQWGS